MNTTTLAHAIEVIQVEARRVEERANLIGALPSNVEGLRALLDELAEADEECRTHHTRFPRIGPGSYEADDPVACKEDWTRCFNRRTAAVERLTTLARASLDIRRAATDADIERRVARLRDPARPSLVIDGETVIP